MLYKTILLLMLIVSCLGTYAQTRHPTNGECDDSYALLGANERGLPSLDGITGFFNPGTAASPPENYGPYRVDSERAKSQEITFVITADELKLLLIIGVFALIIRFIVGENSGPATTVARPEDGPSREFASGAPLPTPGDVSVTYEDDPDCFGAMPFNLPHVQFSHELLGQLAREIVTFRKPHPGIETGYALVGNVSRSTSKSVITIYGMIDAGPNAERSPGHIRYDRVYQQRKLDVLRLRDPRAQYMGDAHLHPGTLDRCSGGDAVTDRASVSASATHELVFVIVTVAQSSRSSVKSVYRDGLKFDFYYLGMSSAYRYVKIAPEIADVPVLIGGPVLEAFFDANPVRAVLDFANLHRLSHYSLQLTESELDGVDPARACICLTHHSRPYEILIEFAADTSSVPRIMVDLDGHLFDYEPEFLNPATAPSIWFTPLVLAVEREIESRETHGRSSEPIRLGGECRARDSPIKPVVPESHIFEPDADS